MKKQIEGTFKELSQVAITKIITQEDLSKSARMVQLFEAGLTVKQISEAMEVRYNFVYNVISNYSVVNDVKIEKTVKAGKKEEIIKLHLEGKTKKEISVELKTNYNYVYNVLKKYTADNPVSEAEAETAMTEEA
jgi:DNA-binding NarL/FixJ family response regulator